MAVTITRAQRDAIYELVVTRLIAIGDVWLSIKRREFADAKKMGREYAEDLRLLEDLGWADTIDRETVALTQPPAELTRTLARLHKNASASVGPTCRARRTRRNSPGGTLLPPRRSARSSADSPSSSTLGR
jgi:hypothetical protein